MMVGWHCKWTILVTFALVAISIATSDSQHQSSLGDETKKSPRRSLQVDINPDEVITESGPVLADKYGGQPGFYHGVASGDPLSDSVIIWTRYTPEDEEQSVKLNYMVHEYNANNSPPTRNHAVTSGSIIVSIDTDWTAKIDVTHLDPNTQYLYYFKEESSGQESPAGLMKTAPAVDDPVEELTYVVLSCSHWGFGYFHAYDIASTIENLDFWIHLGDYIYEYGNRKENYREEGWDPQHELVTLEDYRTRYAQYSTDIAAQNLRRRAPMIAIWDDHEFANDNAKYSAQAHTEFCDAENFDPLKATCYQDEGSYETRVEVAAQAYFEWMPIRQGHYLTDTGFTHGRDATQIIQWGNLATFAAFDSRVYGRNVEYYRYWWNNPDDPMFLGASIYKNISEYHIDPAKSYFETTKREILLEYGDESTKMMGDEQVALLEETFEQSQNDGKPWQLFLTSTIFACLAPFNMQLVLDAAEPESEDQAQLRQLIEFLFSMHTDQGAQLRALTAGQMYGIPLNPDSWDGFMAERKRILQILKDKTNNAIVYSGDSHDSWAFSMGENGDFENTGDKTCVNIATPAVSAQGAGPKFQKPFQMMRGNTLNYDLLHQALVAGQPGLEFANIQYHGFVAVHLTPTTHRSEFHFVTDEIDPTAPPGIETFTRMSYDSFPGKLTAPSQCQTALETVAGSPGSLNPVECSIEFATSRPDYTIPSTAPSSAVGGGGFSSSLSVLLVSLVCWFAFSLF